MTRVRATCPACATEATCDADAIGLFVCTDPVRSFYTFRCTSCGEHVAKPAPARAVQLLVAGGVTVRTFTPPAIDLADGPAIVLDDLIDLHFELEAWTYGAR